MVCNLIQKQPFRILTGRSSRPEVFCENCVFENFTKFTGKHLCHSLFFNKVAGLVPEFLKIFKNTFFYRTLLAVASEQDKLGSSHS